MELVRGGERGVGGKPKEISSVSGRTVYFSSFSPRFDPTGTIGGRLRLPRNCILKIRFDFVLTRLPHTRNFDHTLDYNNNNALPPSRLVIRIKRVKGREIKKG